MGKSIRYSDEFKQEAVNQVAVHGYSVNDVAERLGISTKTLYGWLKKFQSQQKRVKKNKTYELKMPGWNVSWNVLNKKGTC